MNATDTHNHTAMKKVIKARVFFLQRIFVVYLKLNAIPPATQHASHTVQRPRKGL